MPGGAWAVRAGTPMGSAHRPGALHPLPMAAHTLPSTRREWCPRADAAASRVKSKDPGTACRSPCPSQSGLSLSRNPHPCPLLQHHCEPWASGHSHPVVWKHLVHWLSGIPHPHKQSSRLPPPGSLPGCFSASSVPYPQHFTSKPSRAATSCSFIWGFDRT